MFNLVLSQVAVEGLLLIFPILRRSMQLLGRRLPSP